MFHDKSHSQMNTNKLKRSKGNVLGTTCEYQIPSVLTQFSRQLSITHPNSIVAPTIQGEPRKKMQQTPLQVIKQSCLLSIYTKVYMLVKRFNQSIDQALTRSPVKRAHSHTIHQVLSQNNVQHETTILRSGVTGSFQLGDKHTRKEIYCLCTKSLTNDMPLFAYVPPFTIYLCLYLT